LTSPQPWSRTHSRRPHSRRKPLRPPLMHTAALTPAGPAGLQHTKKEGKPAVFWSLVSQGSTWLS
jgi:hypothetical protein